MNTNTSPIDNTLDLENPTLEQKPDVATPVTLHDKASIDLELPQCSDCGSTTPWRMSSWCPDCGYYPAIDARVNGDNEAKEAVEEVEIESDEPRPWSFLKKMNVGIISIFAFTILVRTFYHYADADRGLWTLIQGLAGIVTACSAQALTAIYASKENQQFSLISAVINPIEVWGPSFQNNVFQNRLCALIWGVTTAVLAFAMIGGLTEDHFFKAFEQNTAQFNVLEEIVDTTNVTQNDEEGGEGQLVGAMPDEQSEELDAGDENITNCAVYGYMTSGGESISRILLAANKDDEMVHVAILTAEQLGEDKTAALSNILLTLEVPETTVQTSFSATWVDPSFTISVQHDGLDAFGNLKNARLPEKKKVQKGNSDEDE